MMEQTIYTPSSSESELQESRLTTSDVVATGAGTRIPALLVLYAVTIFFSAFLLFQIQPIIAKIVLPWFGGSSAVWTTCLLFFQIVLLAGYLYAHLSVKRLAPHQQIWLHVFLLTASLVLLRVMPDAAWKPQGAEDPGFRILGLLTVTIGLPY